jgi:hypothetical protein
VGFFENNVYRKVNRWAASLKSEYQLYSYIRSIYSPAYRLGEFWASHILGGMLDPDAGDGKAKASAMPIVIPEDARRREGGRPPTGHRATVEGLQLAGHQGDLDAVRGGPGRRRPDGGG